jgi:carboxyl-terminal processing protease
MIAGPTATAGKAFQRQAFNDKHPTVNPVTGEPLAVEGFLDRTQGYSLAFDQPLPSLGLSRVFVLTSLLTCSASEALINGLAGAGVEVIQIGTRTCGKPYGFYPTDNCGTTYFAIQFQVGSERGAGDYGDGFQPGVALPGCIVADDFDRALGDPDEALVAAALAYRADRSCPAVPTGLVAPTAIAGRTPGKPPWLENQILRRRGR